jgi:biopolymer transport protein ExbB
MGLTVSRSRWAAFLVLAMAVCYVGVIAPSFTPAYAQEGGEENKGKEAPAAGGESKAAPNLFWHIVKSAGIVFGPLLLLVSIGLVALIVLLAMDLRMGVAIPPGFVEEFTDTVNKRQFKQAFDMARNDNSFVARVMTAGMGRLQYGIEDAREASFNMVESCKASKEQLIAYLATIGTLGPILGLVGTVFGMIKSFMVLARSTGSINPSLLSEGISEALVITLLGIGLSVPAIFSHAVFRNRLIRISMDVSNISDDLLTQMYHNSKRPPSSPSMPATPTGNSSAAQQVAIKPG